MNKKTLLTLLQIAFTLGILAWLFRDPARNRQIWEAISQADWRWIAAGFGVFGIVELAAVIRWQVLLRVQGIRIGWGRLSALFMIGIFFNPFMPGGTGGDVAKIFYLLKETPGRKPAAMLAVLMDRMVGLFGLIAIASVVIAMRYRWLTQTPVAAGLLYALLTIFGGALGFLAVSFVVTKMGLVHRLPQKLPMRDTLVDLAAAYGQYGRAWGSSLLALLLCVPVHLGSFTVFYCAGRAFAESARRGALLDFWGIMPIVNTLTSIPVNIGGMGVREKLLLDLLGGLCQIPERTALAISLSGAFVLILWGLVGGVVYLCYRPSEHARLGAMTGEVAAVGREIAETEEAREAR
ncbi:MAG: lysylphosphatidylglycerol synthase transmembrane domain-containing protein [Chthoniobacteraceae bacterium]|nr:lysylphosphatidylglycerol synthase transmembrane domain-containing protein [Chthoniobacteraceae bacterium]